MTISGFPCGNCPIENITGVWRFQRPALYKGKTNSLPGHLLHYVISGSYTVRIGTKVYHPQKGDMLYYYGSEEVSWVGNESDVDFYSVGFIGTAIPVRSADQRIIKGSDCCHKKWDKLWEVSQNDNTTKKALLSYSALLEILVYVFWDDEKEFFLSEGRNWQKIEKMVRSHRLYHISIEELSDKSGLSRSAIYTVCRNEIDSTPNQRIKEIRIEEAKGLLKYTGMRIGEISDFLGYKRIHDFSREFKKESGISGREYRQMVQEI